MSGCATHRRGITGDYFSPMLVKAGEAKLTLRVTVDHSVLELYGQSGRASQTRRVYPMYPSASVGVALVWYHPSDTTGGAPEPPRVSVSAWEMHDALENAPA